MHRCSHAFKFGIEIPEHSVWAARQVSILYKGNILCTAECNAYIFTMLFQGLQNQRYHQKCSKQ